MTIYPAGGGAVWVRRACDREGDPRAVCLGLKAGKRDSFGREVEVESFLTLEEALQVSLQLQQEALNALAGNPMTREEKT